MKKTYYTNIQKKKLCNRNNGELKSLPRFDFQMEDYFSVIFVDSLNKIIEIDPTDQFYIAGGLDVMKDSENLLFYSEDFTLENNKLSFTIDTYTDNYLKHIKNTNTPIYLEIGILNEKKTILLQDTVLAEPRVYLDGVAPTNIENYYTKAQIDEKLAAVEIEQTDPIYTADKPTLALKSEIPTKTSDLQNDSGFISNIPQNLVTEQELENKGYLTSYIQSDPIYTADKPNLALKSEIPTKTSDLQNDSGFISNIPQNLVTEQELNNKGYLTSFTQSDPIYIADKPNLALKSDLFSKSYNDLTDKPTIFTPTTDGDGTKYLADNGQYITIETPNFVNLSLKYDLQNDNGYFQADFSLNYVVQKYLNTYAISDGVLTFNINAGTATENQCPTVEVMIPYTADITTFVFQSDIQQIQIPESIAYNSEYTYNYAVFVARSIHGKYYVNYSYSFGENE